MDHGAVDIDGDMGNLAPIAEVGEVADDILGVAERKSGDHDFSASVEGADDGSAEFLAGTEGIVVEAVAVGGFADHDIYGLQLDGIKEKRAAAAA